jgi:O-antigen/teichoic acid export membrane protein
MIAALRRLGPMVSAIGLRYSAIIIQFALVLLVSRHTSTTTAGTYFIIFGWVNSTYFIAGLGLPDGLVREISHLASTGGEAAIRPLMLRAVGLFAVLTLATAAAGILGAQAFGFAPGLVLWVAAWWLCYAINFFCAQSLLALGRPTAGSFFFYPALNISLLFTLFPYLLFTRNEPVEHLLAAAIAGAAPMALIAGSALATALRRMDRPAGTEAPPVALGAVMSLGFRIAVARVAQTAIYWIPTWIAGGVLMPAAAAVLGLAARLNNAVAAVMAAIRFIVRPQIVAAAARDDWQTISRNARMISTLASGAVLLAILVYLAIGRPLIVGIFGASYAGAFLPLLILLFGTLAEATGGVVDEVLKMTGNASFVLGTLLCVVAGEALFSWAGGRHGLLWLAAAQSLALACLYGTQISFAKWRRGVLLLPMLSPATMKGAVRALRQRTA